jgi:tetratricopeptide (TPR) repeat protein
MNLEKIKEAARRFEQKEDWRRAIEVYQRALDEARLERDQSADPSVFNRVGDLHLKVGDTGAAISCYERALEAYAEQGFLNNAIAIGGKILRVDPARASALLRLAQLNARKNVVAEVRRHLTDYLHRMQRANQLPQAVTALREFVEQECRNAELRAQVIDLVGQLTPSGPQAGDLAALLTDLQGLGSQAPPPSAPESPPSSGLIFLDTSAGFTRTPFEAAGGSGSEVTPVEGLNTVEATLPGSGKATPLLGLETTEFPSATSLTVELVPGIELEESSFGDPSLGVDLEAPLPDPMEGVGSGEPVLGDLVPTALASPADPGLALGDIELEVFDGGDAGNLVLEVPRDPEFITLDEDPPGQELAPHSARPRSEPRPPVADRVAAAEARLARCEAVEDWSGALAAAAELVRLQLDQIPRYQKQVELAYRAGDRTVLTARYLELGDALLRAGMRAPAVAVYQRVLEHEPGDARALGALASLGVSVKPLPPPPAAAPEAAAGDFVDLGALILGDSPAPDSRMRVDTGEPVAPEDEDATFRTILEQFKRGIAENLDTEDFQAHYDLGIAFKEMGLLDEAIAQFQRALRSSEGRLRASEALGSAFHEKGRYAIAAAVLARAIEGLPGDDAEKIGLIYWLGRSLEAQGRDAEALPWYERALAVDIQFLDTGERMQRLLAGGAA